MNRVSIQAEDFDPAVELAALEASGGGGVASFTGIVRGEGGLVALELEHYPAMTMAQVERIVAEASDRWPLLGVRVIHRFGRLEPGERIVFVGTASRHRTAALEACAFLIDWLKSRAPFWKKEHFADRTEWVEARVEDDAKAESWKR
ncbi:MULTISPECIES: molybdenum cofactor biosynthesis protein MoaE [Sphingobium]|uniref:Molybdopterin synthase catalytic subunit n=1 Tax=Sphingobium fuliginis (strain ATCC 27551) TaxID=336203 RepID=A0ABQ1FBA5_SPHSA|nr:MULTISPECIES: molybdenum cofactor biosynthesis protein MoaE [Sphingobium]AJR25710.1 molybdopterin synthase catalytic subunit [Sphingobium sp. YBL2]PNQ04637.1 molybdopterin synthase catalytic subunit [Sphingobium sp. SA916]RYL96088.1 molybdenum cofactor biosynthesis protein MoaE [Sphingobium fuliginis]UXC92353.1 molybdenum cofactor biosynthesis protein MoaE [Sphingobium sp. RSMS]WDA37889.1 molybdenum cofactor biosynthesis protein MoaE [Sphingobium sp. YC-XJ3]